MDRGILGREGQGLAKVGLGSGKLISRDAGRGAQDVSVGLGWPEPHEVIGLLAQRVGVALLDRQGSQRKVGLRQVGCQAPSLAPFALGSVYIAVLAERFAEMVMEHSAIGL